MSIHDLTASRARPSRPWRAGRVRTASAYDALGRVTTLGDTKHATSQGYGYDDQGLRIKVTDSATGKVSYHLYDEARHLIAEVEVPSGGSLAWTKDLLYAGDKEVAEVDGSHTWVEFLDHLGSPRYQWDGTAVTGIDGVHLIAQKYATFGEYLNDPATQAKFAKGFTNHEQTDPSGLIYMQARFYAPMYGRFLSPDPARDQHFEETQSWNIYSYVQNDPTMNIDPNGQFKTPIHQAITARAAAEAGITNRRFIAGIVSRVKETDHRHPMLKNQHFDSKANIGQIQDNFSGFVARKESLGTVKGIGDALHAVQDFYSHSNYVELYLGVHPDAKPGDLPTLKEALASGDKDLIKSLNSDLKTGNFNIMKPFDSSPGTHGEINKDSSNPKQSTEGAKDHNGHTLNEYAVGVAERESRQLLERNKDKINGAR